MNVTGLTMCFCQAALTKLSLPKIRRISNVAEHYVTLNHYPVNESENSKEISKVARAFGYKVFDQESDRGLQGAFNNWLCTVKPQTEFILGIDPDSDAEEGFLPAMVDVMNSNPDVKVVALYGLEAEIWEREKTLKPELNTTANGTRYYILPHAAMFNITLWRTEWLKSIGGIQQPNKFYGGIEQWLHEQKDCQVAYLYDFKEKYNSYKVPADENYHQWKLAHAQKGYTGGFKQWLIDNDLYLSTKEIATTILDFVRAQAPSSTIEIYKQEDSWLMSVNGHINQSFGAKTDDQLREYYIENYKGRTAPEFKVVVN